MPDCIICGPDKHGIAVIAPAFPEPCSFFRVVRFNASRTHFQELAYWNVEEWQQDDSELTTIGAIAGAIKQVNDGEEFAAVSLHRPKEPWNV